MKNSSSKPYAHICHIYHICRIVAIALVFSVLFFWGAILATQDKLGLAALLFLLAFGLDLSEHYHEQRKRKKAFDFSQQEEEKAL